MLSLPKLESSINAPCNRYEEQLYNFAAYFIYWTN